MADIVIEPAPGGGAGVPLPADPPEDMDVREPPVSNEDSGDATTIPGQVAAALEAMDSELGKLKKQLKDSKLERALLKPPAFEKPEEEDFYGFRSAFYAVAGTNRWTTATAVAALRNSLKGVARSATLELPLEDCTTLDEALQAVEDLFLPPSTSRLAQTAFEQAGQKDKESLLSYHARLARLFRRAYPNMGGQDHDILLRRFAQGIRHEQVKLQVKRSNARTYREALRAAQDEAAIQDERHGGVGKALMVTASGFSATHFPAPQAAGRKEGRRNPTGCWHCNDPNHIRRHCPKFLKSKAQAKKKGGKDLPRPPGAPAALLVQAAEDSPDEEGNDKATTGEVAQASGF